MKAIRIKLFDEKTPADYGVEVSNLFLFGNHPSG